MTDTEREATRKWRKTPKGRAYCNRRRLFQRYGLKVPQLEAMWKQQNGLCAICLKPLGPGRLRNIDHCHTTGRVRGILCPGCNSGLGHFKDNTTVLEQAIVYLKRVYDE